MASQGSWIEHVGVETFDPQQQGRYSQQSSYKPSEEYTKK
tara:strand:+ start:84 stop:203 length:120 start_codon:yes stop_codon:yes gene_type:complete